jgi:hypothetical protein
MAGLDTRASLAAAGRQRILVQQAFAANKVEAEVQVLTMLGASMLARFPAFNYAAISATKLGVTTRSVQKLRAAQSDGWVEESNQIIQADIVDLCGADGGFESVRSWERAYAPNVAPAPRATR